MVEKYCEFCVDDGTLCGLKPFQIVVNFLSKEVFSVCRKHKFNRIEGHIEVINIKKLEDKKLPKKIVRR